MKSLQYLLFLFYSISCFGQTKNLNHLASKSDLDTIKGIDLAVNGYPLIRDTTGDYPDVISVEGKITAIVAGISCGVYCSCGTVELHLTKKIKNYNQPNVYIAMPCVNVEEKIYIGKTVKIRVKLLSPKNNECFWLGGNSDIDSKGLPFYIPQNLDDKLEIITL